MKKIVFILCLLFCAGSLFAQDDGQSSDFSNVGDLLKSADGLNSEEIENILDSVDPDLLEQAAQYIDSVGVDNLMEGLSAEDIIDAVGSLDPELVAETLDNFDSEALRELLEDTDPTLIDRASETLDSLGITDIFESLDPDDLRSAVDGLSTKDLKTVTELLDSLGLGEVITIIDAADSGERVRKLKFITKMQEKHEETMLERMKTYGTHSPTKATLMAMFCPGLGQIYNKQYWKLAILYGGVGLCIYGISWNNTTYVRYRGAYYDLTQYMDSLTVDPDYPYPDKPAWEKIELRGTTWKELFTERPSSLTRYHDIFYKKRRSFKRNRDLCYLALAGVYVINILDACVYAHFYDFYINDDLSLHWEPHTSFNKRTGKSTYGASISLTF